MKILFATDGSEYSNSAARFLTRLNWSHEDSLTVFHAIYAVPFRDDEQFYFNTLTAIKKELAPRIIDSALAVLRPVQASISVEIGESPPVQCTPEQCILDAAESAGADCIVMGARGIRGLTSYVLGSVTRLVAIRSSRPVLVVKPDVSSRPGALTILFAADGSEASLAAADFAASLPFPDDTTVTVAHIISSPFDDVPERYLMEVTERVKEAVAGTRAMEFAEAEKIIERARAALRKRFKNIQVVTKVGDPSLELLNEGEKAAADLIAAGSRGLRGLKGMLGSVSRNVLTHSKCSVLIGKARREQ